MDCLECRNWIIAEKNLPLGGCRKDKLGRLCANADIYIGHTPKLVLLLHESERTLPTSCDMYEPRSTRQGIRIATLTPASMIDYRDRWGK